MPDECWALEYARGNIVSMLPFGLADTILSTVDLVTLWQTVEVSAHEMLSNARPSPARHAPFAFELPRGIDLPLLGCNTWGVA
jgi:hypothetical protein